MEHRYQNRTYEERFLDRLARGEDIAQEEYDTLLPDLSPADVASALVRRFHFTGYHAALVEAARLYQRAGEPFLALEICSRYPLRHEFRQLTQKILPAVRLQYPGTRMVGKLLDEAFLVVNLDSGHMTRFPPLMPSTGSEG